jgi:hypothetical protein
MTTNQEQTVCKGDSEGVHIFIFTSFGRPAQCYNCGQIAGAN